MNTHDKIKLPTLPDEILFHRQIESLRQSGVESDKEWSEECVHCPWKHPIYISVPPGKHADILCHVCGDVHRIFSQHLTL